MISHIEEAREERVHQVYHGKILLKTPYCVPYVHKKNCDRVPRCKKRIGNIVSASCFIRFLHPSAPLRAKYVDDYNDVWIDGLNVVGREEKVIRRIDCALVLHDDFLGQVFHVAFFALKQRGQKIIFGTV